ncbi:MAG TPA: response regulator [Polyangiaceae bacterium]|nr:response regulator [Polyangiaceae bacterium]
MEDDDDAREVLGELIDSMGHEALSAATADEAVEHAGREPLDVALIDLGLPGTDGYEAARRLRSLGGAHVHLVALTGYSDATTRLRAREAGFDDFLVKPTHTEALAGVMRERP